MDNLFAGADYVPDLDDIRLLSQQGRIKKVMSDGKWHTLAEIEEKTKDPQASISAQLRFLRKPKFGGYVIGRRSRGKRIEGLYEYNLSSPSTIPVENPYEKSIGLSKVIKARKSRLRNYTIEDEILSKKDYIGAATAILMDDTETPDGWSHDEWFEIINSGKTKALVMAATFIIIQIDILNHEQV